MGGARPYILKCPFAGQPQGGVTVIDLTFPGFSGLIPVLKWVLENVHDIEVNTQRTVVPPLVEVCASNHLDIKVLTQNEVICSLALRRSGQESA